MKIEGDTTCPNCKKDHAVEFDIDNLDIKKVEVPQVRVNSVQSAQVTEQIEKPVGKVKEVLKIPSYIPKYKCKNCDSNHKNKAYTNMPKARCANCGQFSPDGVGSCPWCDNDEFEELDKDDLKELGIPEPEEHNHEDD